MENDLFFSFEIFNNYKLITKVREKTRMSAENHDHNYFFTIAKMETKIKMEN